MSFFYGDVRYDRKLKAITKDISGVMEIHEDGSFEIKTEDYDYETMYQGYTSIDIDKPKNKKIYICHKDNNFNIINHTDISFIPYFEDMSAFMEACINNPSGIKTRPKGAKRPLGDKFKGFEKEIPKHMTGMLPQIGLNVFTMPDNEEIVYYSVGTTDNPKSKQEKLMDIYSFQPIDNEYGDKTNLIPEVLSLLEFSLIRSSNEVSVLPYPFKFLREYLEILNNSKNVG